jgi:tRNA nucleotidyltransferase/poly(A) polymerase
VTPLKSTPQRDFAVEIVTRLRAAGHEALLAGGCVRDEVLGKTPKDFDVATSATPEEVRKVFGHRRTLAIGAAFGVIAVLGRRGAEPVEVATFREDTRYSDGRRPDSVRFSTAEADARRRDFTVNGLFLDPVAGRVIDYVGGQADLARGIVRAIGNPRDRLVEDKLRLLRAVRCAATLGFELEPATAAAVRSMAEQVTVVSPERIAAELRRILVDASRKQGMELLQDLGLLPHVVPELSAVAATSNLKSSKWQTTLRVLDALDKPSFPLALAAALHESNCERPVHAVGQRLRLSNKEIDRAAWILEVLPLLQHAHERPWSRVQRALVHEGAAEAVQLLEAIEGAPHAAVRFCLAKLAMPKEELDPLPLLTGEDLIAHGLQPGPQFSELLEQVRDAQLEGRVADVEGALRLVDDLTRDQPGDARRGE